MLAALVAVGGFAACAKNSGPYGMVPPDPNASGSAGTTGGILTGIAGHIGITGIAGSMGTVDAGTPSGTVAITIQSPMADSLLSDNAAANVSAKVTIAGGTDLVDPSSVRVSLLQDGFVTPVSAAPLIAPSGDLFTGKLSLAGLKTGDYTITVTARSSTNLMGSASVKIKIDGGPAITVLSPIAGHHYKGSIIVQVVVDPGAYGPASAIACMIAGTALTLQPAGNTNQYRAVFDLTMPVALTGDQLFEVSAKDAKGTSTDIKLTFNVDITGPEITMPVPAPGSITGQVIRIAANITDSAGVDDSSVQVLIGDKTMPQFKLALTPDSTGAYSVLFDTKLLTACKLPEGSSLCVVRPTLSFRATDALGNDTTLSYEIAIDNIPPIADLVPPDIRVSKLDDGLRCSFAFNPLSNKLFSGDSPDDGCRVPQLFDLRARIEDSGNYGTGLKQDPIAGIDPAVTAAYILADTTQPLVVDQDGDGFCDVINPKLVPTTSPLTGAPRQVLKVRLKPVPPAGVGDYRPDLTAPAECVPGKDVNPPENICNVEQPTVAISYAGGAPAIWSIEPISPDDPRYCFGSQLDTFANNVPDSGSTTAPGWRCVAVATADLNGNLSTSAPIRLWVDSAYSPQSFCKAPPPTAGPMPSCTGTYNKVTDTLSAKPCISRNFKPAVPGDVEICYKNDCF